jgi:iron complex outermembrane receptor protein
MWRGQAVLNVPLSDSLKVRLDVDRMKRDGYMKNRSGIGPDAYNDSNYIYARLSIQAQLTPSLENYTLFHYSNSDTKGFASRIVTCARTLPEQFQSSLGAITGPSACTQLDRMIARGYGPLETEVAVKDPYFKIKQWQFINHTTLQAGDNFTIKNIASYSQLTSDLNYNLAGENLLTQKNPLLPLATPFILGVPFTPTLVSQDPGFHSQDQWTFTDELRFQGATSDGRLNWQAGGYIEVSKSPNFNAGLTQIFLSCQNIQTLQCFDPFGFGQVSHAKQKSTFVDKAFYAQATYKLSEQLSATAGFRYTWDTTRVLNEATRFFFPPAAPGTVVQACADTLRLGTGP